MSESSQRSSRRNTESNKIELVQIDGLVLMKLIKHCHEAERSGSAFVQGALLGLVSELDTKLEVTHCFPFTTVGEDLQDDGDFQLTMMRRLRQMNIDHQQVGWYQASQFANFLSPTLLESQFSYQTSIEESICLVFDTSKTAQGFVSLKAFRLTNEALKLVKEGDYTPDTVKDLNISFENLLTEVPVVIKNSHLMNALLLELQEQIPLDQGGAQFMDLGTSETLEAQLRVMMDALDELNSESLKFNKHQQLVLKQIQEKNKYIQRRTQENKQRIDRNEDPLPMEDLNKLFKSLPPPSRMNPLILSGTIQNTSEEVSEFCSQSMAKLFISEPLQAAKASVTATPQQ